MKKIKPGTAVKKKGGRLILHTVYDYTRDAFDEEGTLEEHTFYVCENKRYAKDGHPYIGYIIRDDEIIVLKKKPE